MAIKEVKEVIDLPATKKAVRNVAEKNKRLVKKATATQEVIYQIKAPFAQTKEIAVEEPYKKYGVGQWRNAKGEFLEPMELEFSMGQHVTNNKLVAEFFLERYPEYTVTALDLAKNQKTALQSSHYKSAFDDAEEVDADEFFADEGSEDNEYLPDENTASIIQ